MIDSLLPMNNIGGGSSNKYFDYGSPTNSSQGSSSFLLSPSSSSSLLKTNTSNSHSILQTILPGEEISTIFVVGFPDNMQEREFLNMFMFSPGFEAATLKVPATITSSTATATLANMEDENNRKQIVSLSLYFNTLFCIRQLIKKEIIIQIGFAKFRTRLEALDAKEILNGRKIDLERGCILKAEMAKKNLHTKKEIQQQQQLLQQQQQQQQQSINAIPVAIKTPYEAFHSVPHTSTQPHAFSPSTSPPNNHINIIPTSTKSTSYTLNSHHSSHFSRYSTKLNMIDRHTNNPTANNSLFGIMENTKTYPSSNTNLEYPSLLHKLYNNRASASPPPPPTLPTNNQDELILSQLIVSASASTPILSKDYYNARPQQQQLPAQNNIDQNPPCNTLYVGNLPLNTNEEELRIMFSKCPGYKRLSFRTKSNGPMCFVEFEDIQYATIALQELHGNPLSNSVKGGIRLSFSKNPLVKIYCKPITR